MSKDTYGKVKFAAPKGWVLDYHREWVGSNHHDYADDLDQPILKRKGTFARNQTEFESVHDIELRSHYNGSSPTAFGGAKQWPVVTSKTAFNEGEYTLAAEFSYDVAQFIDCWLRIRKR